MDNKLAYVNDLHEEHIIKVAFKVKTEKRTAALDGSDGPPEIYTVGANRPTALFSALSTPAGLRSLLGTRNMDKLSYFHSRAPKLSVRVRNHVIQ